MQTPANEKASIDILSQPVPHRGRNYYEIFESVLTEARYRKVVRELVEQAEDGDIKAIRLVIEHAQGKPTQRHEIVNRQEDNLAKIQQLLADAGQPVEWAIVAPDDAGVATSISSPSDEEWEESE